MCFIRFNETYDLFYDKRLFFVACGIEKNKSINDFTKDEWRVIIKQLDKINSTHLSVSGNRKGDGQGLELFLSNFYYKREDYLKRIAHGDEDIVNVLAGLVDGRNNFSFATKFCGFINRVFYKRDDYVIFDSIFENAMPYVEEKYCGQIDKCKRLRFYANERNYCGYKNAIDFVLKEIKLKCCEITRFEFDQMVWYYYKNKPSQLKAIKQKQYER